MNEREVAEPGDMTEAEGVNVTPRGRAPDRHTRAREQHGDKVRQQDRDRQARYRVTAKGMLRTIRHEAKRRKG